MAMAPKIIILTGAPKADSLDPKDFLDHLQPSLAKFLGSAASQITDPPASLSPGGASWRVLSFKPQHLPTGFSQLHEWRAEYGQAEFFNSQDLSFMSNGSAQALSQIHESQAPEDILSQFYEESFAVHEDITSSALPIPSQPSQNNDGKHTYLDDSGASFLTSQSNTSLDSISALMPPPVLVPSSGILTNVNGVPSSHYLNSIQPQTVTINVIVGILSISPPRLIRTRRGADVELVEIIVGDETKSGFSINIWLDPVKSRQGEEQCRAVLESLRLQDVVLFKNVALHSFRGRVYGQSLRKDVTKIHLLYRKLLDRHDNGGCYSVLDLNNKEITGPQIVKTRNVREWVLGFVGKPARQESKVQTRSRSKKWRDEVLPPDTQ